MRFGAVLLLLALGGCASDAVLKPAVVGFVGDARTATAAVDKGYDALAASTNDNAALLLAANPECGVNTRVLARAANPELDAVLRRPGAQAAADALARARGLARSEVPGAGFCVAPFELDVARRVLGPTGFDALPVRSVPLMLLSGREFDAQRDAVAAVGDYVAALAEAADDPALDVQPAIADAAARLRAVGTGAAEAAAALKLAKDGAPDAAKALMADDGPVAAYAGAVGALAGQIEMMVKEARDVRALRARLLAPENRTEELIRAVGAEADRWWGQQALNGQAEAMSRSAGLAADLPRMSFQERTDAMRAFVGAAASARAAGRAPYGRMMDALAAAHADLRRIAREEYTPAERRALIGATLERLGATLKAIAGVAAL